MAEVGNTLFCAAIATALWTLIGSAIAARIAPNGLRWCLAPGLGWAVHNAVALPLFYAIGLTRSAVIATVLLLVAVALAILWRHRATAVSQQPSSVLLVAILGVAALAFAPMAAILPKGGADGVMLAAPIFEHSKVALIDEIMRSGVPAANPFFSEIGAPERVSYYYLWHFSAAMMALATGVSGWEADAALTWFTAFASLLVVVGFAAWIGGRASAGLFVVAIAVAESARIVVEWLFGQGPTQSAVLWATGYGGWLTQVSWAPQHVAGAMSVVLACYVLLQLQRRRDPWLIVLVALLVAAGFESSVWAGLAFAVAAVAIGLKVLWLLPRRQRLPFAAGAAIAALLAIVFVAPFSYDQITTIAVRDGGSPIWVGHLPVLGDAVPDTVRRLLDVPAYWLIYLPLELPASYPAGLAMLLTLVFARRMDLERGQVVTGFGLLIASSLIVSWLLVGDLGGNNDLSWRSALPAALLLMAFAAAGLAQWTATGARIPATLALLGILVGLPNGVSFIVENISGAPSASAQAFARTPAMWDAVRRHSSSDARVANNPLFVGDVTAWPVNISWALLADRRSCYAGYNLGIPFAPVSAARRTEIDALFARVFEGDAKDGDLQQLAERHRCDVIVVAAQDGAWLRDPFAASGIYELVEERSGAWRIYRKAVQRTR
jgi:hypothetical protein